MLQGLDNGSSIYVFKYGALGDVVRTAYIITELAKKKSLNVHWVTNPDSIHLLRFNPYISSVIDKNSFVEAECDLVLSLDDERDSIAQASAMCHKIYFGTRLDTTSSIGYTDTSALWNDMGLLSNYGKVYADKLKRENTLGHAQIFSQMLGLDDSPPIFFGNPVREEFYDNKYQDYDFVVGLNPYAGKRWPSKEIPPKELEALIVDLDSILKSRFSHYLIILHSDAQNYQRASAYPGLTDGLIVENTSISVLDFAASIKHCDLYITADTLGLHLAISQRVPTVACFTATSAAEIDSHHKLRKVCSLSDDYCSYSPSADNSTITASRIIDAISDLGVLKNI